jgi:hypothetical protein
MTRAQGVRLGRPRQLPQPVVDRILRERKQGATLTEITEGLNRDEVATAQGGKRWYASTVRSVINSPDNRDLD